MRTQSVRGQQKEIFRAAFENFVESFHILNYSFDINIAYETFKLIYGGIGFKPILFEMINWQPSRFEQWLRENELEDELFNQQMNTAMIPISIHTRNRNVDKREWMDEKRKYKKYD